jgi:hypothetical protein
MSAWIADGASSGNGPTVTARPSRPSKRPPRREGIAIQLTAQRLLADRTGGSRGVLLWTIAGFALYLLLGLASIFATVVFEPALAAMGLRVEAGELGLSVRNALHPLVWGLLVAAVSVPIGRRLVPEIRPRSGWLVLLVGLVLASATTLLMEEFVRARMSYFDLEYVGFTLLTWPALVAIALCAWAALAVPPGTSVPIAIPLVVAVAGLSVALLPSIAGAADGIEMENIPLALLFLVDVVYAVLCIAVVFRHAGAAPPAS